MKALKIAAAAIGAVVLLVLGVLVLLAALVDGDWMKGQLAAAVQERTGRSLRIDGGVRLSFWPGLGIRVSGITLSEPASSQEFAALAAARVSVAPGPLLAGRLVAETIALDGPSLTLVRRKDGTLNIDDLLGGSGGRRSDPFPPIQLAGLRLTGGRLTWLDESSGRSTTVSDIELTTGPLSLEADGLRIDTPRLAARAANGTDQYRLQITAPTLRGGPDGLAIDRLGLDLEARVGQSEIRARLGAGVVHQAARRLLTLDGLAGQLELSHPQLPMRTLRLPLSGHATAELAKPSIGVQLASRLDGGGVALAMQVSRLAPPAVAFDLQIEQLDVDRYLPGGQGDSGSELAGPRGLDLDGAIRIGRLRFAGFDSRDARLSVSLRDGRLQYSGPAGQVAEGRTVRPAGSPGKAPPDGGRPPDRQGGR